MLDVDPSGADVDLSVHVAQRVSHEIGIALRNMRARIWWEAQYKVDVFDAAMLLGVSRAFIGPVTQCAVHNGIDEEDAERFADSVSEEISELVQRRLRELPQGE